MEKLKIYQMNVYLRMCKIDGNILFFTISKSTKNNESNDFHRMGSAFSTQRIFHAECMETRVVTPRDI